jgi:hypothetical protein
LNDVINEDEGMGNSFWVKFVAVLIGGAIAAFIGFLLFGWLWASVGFLGGILLMIGVALAFGYWYDRREVKRRQEFVT